MSTPDLQIPDRIVDLQAASSLSTTPERESFVVMEASLQKKTSFMLSSLKVLRECMESAAAFESQNPGKTSAGAVGLGNQAVPNNFLTLNSVVCAIHMNVR